jgi:hypothetical protein
LFQAAPANWPVTQKTRQLVFVARALRLRRAGSSPAKPDVYPRHFRDSSGMGSKYLGTITLLCGEAAFTS